ncbi:hypothetical protein Tco_1019749 [Tanacetum coccineum]|uniref:Uncharacterized protein n=1 Tax=Tanacetum coccineum TaxID=301880 RepID=A0ABQ5FZQ6_9ASTR
MANVTSLLTSLCNNFKDSASTSNSGTLPSQTVTNPRQQINAITTRSGKTLEGPSTPLVPTPVVSNPQKEPEQNPETSTEKVQNPNLENTAHVPPPEEEDSIFIEIPKPKAKKTVNVETQDIDGFEQDKKVVPPRLYNQLKPPSHTSRAKRSPPRPLSRSLSPSFCDSIGGNRTTYYWINKPMPGEYIASAPLSPLVKTGGGIRPIVVGRVWRHLVSKVGAIMIGHSLDGLQFGVGVSGGGEAILHAVNHLIEGRGDYVGLSMLLVDFKNDLVDREAWYLDDGTIVGDTFVGDTLLEASEDDNDILDNLSLDSRFYAKKVIRGLKIRSSVKSFGRFLYINGSKQRCKEGQNGCLENLVKQKKPPDFSSLPPGSSLASRLDASACWLDVFADL